jgi:TetR/AcrR family transcriptional regulator, regulator of autoinduction and epiphytic fitness
MVVKSTPAGGRRQERARQTRRRILAAAQSLFVEQGYAATTMQQIADRADVAWQTVYAVFGNKPAILASVFDVAVAGDDEPIPLPERPFVRAIAEAPEPREKARLFAAHMRRTGERTAAVLSVLEAGAAGDADVAALWAKLQAQRLDGMTQAATLFANQRALRPELSVAQAADVLWTLTGPWLYRSLVTDRGWTLDQYETWMAETLDALLMRPPRPPGGQA